MLEFLVFILATWRLARLLADEAGPYDVLGRLRELAGVGYDDVGNVYGSNELARGLICYPMGGTIDGVQGDHVSLAPPYNASDEELSLAVSLLGEAVDASMGAF